MAEVQDFHATHEPYGVTPEGIGSVTAKGLSIQWGSDLEKTGATLITVVAIARDRAEYHSSVTDGALDDVADKLTDILNELIDYEEGREDLPELPAEPEPPVEETTDRSTTDTDSAIVCGPYVPASVDTSDSGADTEVDVPDSNIIATEPADDTEE